MMNKKEDWLSEFILFRWGHRNSVSDLLAHLTNVVAENRNNYEDFCYYLSTFDDDHEAVIETYGIRDETEKEYKERIFEEEKRKELDQEMAEEEEKKRRLQRFKLYQELKEEFGQ